MECEDCVRDTPDIVPERRAISRTVGTEICKEAGERDSDAVPEVPGDFDSSIFTWTSPQPSQKGALPSSVIVFLEAHSFAKIQD